MDARVLLLMVWVWWRGWLRTMVQVSILVLMKHVRLPLHMIELDVDASLYGCEVLIHYPELLPSFVCLLPDDPESPLSLQGIEASFLLLEFLMQLLQGFEASHLSFFTIRDVVITYA